MSASGPVPSLESLASDLEAAKPILIANGWASESKLRVIASAIREPSEAPTRSLSRLLVERQLLNREQAAELDQIIAHQVLFPRYRLLRRIGAGGMGMVYLARQADTGRLVAFKSINARLATDDDFVNRFHRETKVLLGIRHPHIAEVLESGEAEGQVFLAMEYIEGDGLMNVLRARRVLTETFALRIAAQVATGLHHVYDVAGLIHRDIKPENILLTGLGDGDDKVVAKLIDFGLVKSNRDSDRLTQTGMTIGTPLYMSPEQVRGEALDGRSDLYGLGATLYHLLTGMTPFTGGSPGAIMSAHLTEAVPDPGRVVPSLSPATRQLIMMALAKKPADRFATGEAMAAACQGALESLGAAPETEQFRFLKRPLVVNRPPARRQPTPPTPPEKPITERIIERHQERRGDAGGRPPSGDQARRPGSANVARNAGAPPRPPSGPVGRPPAEAGAAAARPPALRPGSEATLRPTTDPAKPGADAHRPRHEPGPALEPMPGRSVQSSRVYRDDPELSGGGIGAAPWILFSAVALGVGILIFVVIRG